MVYHAAVQGIEIESVESSLEGDMDVRGMLGLSEEVRKGDQAVGDYTDRMLDLGLSICAGGSVRARLKRLGRIRARISRRFAGGGSESCTH